MAMSFIEEGMREYSFYGAGQGSDKFYEMTTWCSENLYHGGYYEPNWWYEYPFIFFSDEKEYMLFLLRWQ
jgi:hypothetical protein